MLTIPPRILFRAAIRYSWPIIRCLQQISNRIVTSHDLLFRRAVNHLHICLTLRTEPEADPDPRCRPSWTEARRHPIYTTRTSHSIHVRDPDYESTKQ